MTERLTPEHPHDAGVAERQPDRAHDEATHLLADEARRRLRTESFTDAEIREWTAAYLEEDRSGDIEGLLQFIAGKERGGQPRG